MKHTFKLSKTNVIYAIVALILMGLLHLPTLKFDPYSLGYTTGSVLGIILIPTLIALLFWLISGKKEKGGTTTFNIVLTLMLFSSLGEMGRELEQRRKPIDNINKAIVEYKKQTLANPDSVDSNYVELSTNIKNSFDSLIKTSRGEERKVYIAARDFMKKSDSLDTKWTEAYNTFAEVDIMDYNRLNSNKEYKFQKKIIQQYINQSIIYRTFVQNRFDYFEDKTKNINKTNKVYKGFQKQDSIQKPVFNKYLSTHINYGHGIIGILEILEQEDGKWSFENETLLFDSSEAQSNYAKILDEAIKNETIINDLSIKLIEIM